MQPLATVNAATFSFKRMDLADTVLRRTVAVFFSRSAGNSQFQLPRAGGLGSVLHARRRQLRVGDHNAPAVRGVPAGRLHHPRGHGRHQDVLHTGGHRRHRHQDRRRRHQPLRRIVLRRYRPAARAYKGRDKKVRPQTRDHNSVKT